MIVFSSVTKEFLPEGFAIKDVSFQIDPGELVLLTGPSGSGKTTVMKLLTKEYQPTSGKITFHDTDLSKIKNSQVPQHRRKIGVIFQDYKLIPELNIWENIALPLSIIGKKEQEIESRVTDLLELVSLTNKAMHFPKQLSGGEAQRISIARALSTGPAIIFADEPTGNLDKENSLQIAQLLAKINSLGTTVIFATHDHDVIDLFDGQRHIVLSGGSLVSDSESKKKKAQAKEQLKQKENSTKTEKADTKEQESQKNSSETPQIKPVKKQGFLARLFGSKKTTVQDTSQDTSKDTPEDEQKDTQEEAQTTQTTTKTAESIKVTDSNSKKSKSRNKKKSK